MRGNAPPPITRMLALLLGVAALAACSSKGPSEGEVKDLVLARMWQRIERSPAFAASGGFERAAAETQLYRAKFTLHECREAVPNLTYSCSWTVEWSGRSQRESGTLKKDANGWTWES